MPQSQDSPKARKPGASDGAEDSAKELREKKRLLAQLVVHDLRSPLSAVQGYLDLLVEELEPDAGTKVKQYLEDATLLVGKALGLVATILDVDELEDGMLRAVPQPVKLAELIERERIGNRAQFEVRQLQLAVDVDPELIVRLDPDLFGRVFENLIDNASRYAPRGGRCAISAKRDEHGVEIAIGNNGPAVPAGERDAIFGRYFQVEQRRASARANRGLGLYFCKLAVEAHSGTIRVEERGDLGAVFVLTIPEQPPTG
jgi:two-component system, OmpR family, heavy metal sensor histidine kinase CusS